MSKWMKNKFKIDTKRHHGVFGVSMVRNVQRSGQPLPQCIQYALQYLRRAFILSLLIRSLIGSRTQIRDWPRVHPSAHLHENPSMTNKFKAARYFPKIWCEN